MDLIFWMLIGGGCPLSYKVWLDFSVVGKQNGRAAVNKLAWTE